MEITGLMGAGTLKFLNNFTVCAVSFIGRKTKLEATLYRTALPRQRETAGETAEKKRRAAIPAPMSRRPPNPNPAVQRNFH